MISGCVGLTNFLFVLPRIDELGKLEDIACNPDVYLSTSLCLVCFLPVHTIHETNDLVS